jgi:hypothetical protein
MTVQKQQSHQLPSGHGHATQPCFVPLGLTMEEVEEDSLPGMLVFRVDARFTLIQKEEISIAAVSTLQGEDDYQ